MTQASARASHDEGWSPGADYPSKEDLARTVVFDAAGDLSVACDEAIRIMVECALPIYQRSGQLVKVIAGGDGRPAHKLVRRDPLMPRIVAHDEASLVDEITRHMLIYRPNKAGRRQRCDCPPILARTILARREWPGVPHLHAVLEHPVVLPDGKLLDQSGFDASTGLLLVLPRSTFISVDEELGEHDCAVALESLRHLLSGFAFESDLDLSVTMAYLLTFFVRSVLPTAPLFAWTAHTFGSGKSLIARIGSYLSTGREPAFMVAPQDPAELDKAIFAVLREGGEHIAIDNIDIPVAGSVWAAVVTSTVYRGRVLGESKMIDIPIGAVLSLNGNNLSIRGDLIRRSLVASLDPLCERPAERDFEFHPIHEIEAGRGEYVHAALVIICAYLRSGTQLDLRPFGSFELWSRMVREPLVWLGLPDPVEAIRIQEATDPDREALRAMLESVKTIFGMREFRSSDLIAATRPEIRNDDRQRLFDALAVVCERNGALNPAALGKWLLRMNGRYEGSIRFERVRSSKDHAWWKVGS
jgi:hypothetical protein